MHEFVCTRPTTDPWIGFFFSLASLENTLTNFGHLNNVRKLLGITRSKLCKKVRGWWGGGGDPRNFFDAFFFALTSKLLWSILFSQKQLKVFLDGPSPIIVQTWSGRCSDGAYLIFLNCCIFRIFYLDFIEAILWALGSFPPNTYWPKFKNCVGVKPLTPFG